MNEISVRLGSVVTCLMLIGLTMTNRPVIAEMPTRPRPNVLLIVADDLGYSDLGCYGGEIPTPALDDLAARGLRLTRMTNGGMCVVTRASLMTGRWWPRALSKFQSTPLMSETFSDAGYRTALIGKWHLAGHPMDRGFDHFFGFLNGFADHFAGGPHYRNDRDVFRDFGSDYYSSDAFSDAAIRFIQKNAGDAEQPFFVSLNYQAPHNPLQAPADDIARHRGNYTIGWDAIRKQRFERQKELGVVSRVATLPARPTNLPSWESLTDAQRDLEDLRMSVYAAMVDRMDRGIGRVIDAIRDAGELDNTLIVFMSDNGTDSFSVVDDAMLKQGKLPGDPGSNFQPGTGWAYASVTPWRMYKISQHAGGVTSGAIVCWPSFIKPAAINPVDRIRSASLHVVDMLPTLMEACGLQPRDSIDGRSFFPLLNDVDWLRAEPMFYQYVDNRAIRTSTWTMAEVDGGGWELFDATKDVLESNDVAAANPNVVADLEKQWLAWWTAQTGESDYKPTSSRNSIHYSPQGDRGTGVMYRPRSMPR